MAETNGKKERSELFDRFTENGSSFEGMSERDILRTLFGSILGSRRDVDSIAENVLFRFGSIRAFLGADADELLSSGFTALETENLILLSRLLRRSALERYPLPVPVYDEKAVKGLLTTLFVCEMREVTYLFPVKGNMIVGCCRLAAGSNSSVQFDYGRMVDLLGSATGYILAHNHPGSSCKPSAMDVSSARFIAGKLKMLGYDHICHYTLGDDGIGIVLGRPNYLQLMMDGSV